MASGCQERQPSGNDGFVRVICVSLGDHVLDERKRLFLRLGDRVTHAAYEEWGLGAVVEVMTSIVPAVPASRAFCSRMASSGLSSTTWIASSAAATRRAERMAIRLR